MAICVEHYILWQYFLDIQAWLSYTHFQRKQVLIKSYQIKVFFLFLCGVIRQKVVLK